MKPVIKNLLIISGVLIVMVLLYLTLTYYLKDYYLKGIANNNSFKNNEFGDFIGGILNPLFTLLSTISIIFLTYIVAKGEDNKATKAIETQKRITLNQMRQSAFENLVQKTNLYVYELDKLSVHEVKNKFMQSVLTSMIKNEENGKGRVTVWLIILNELENFTQYKYLFSELFQNEDFRTKHNEFIKVTAKLSQEQDEFKFVNSKTIGKYINIQQDFLTFIGNYIYSEF
ncbi:hypothetical protein [Paraflavitalea sp. CAU 1676]|uniref:hypothetical protein n=1 Tax=Paraflavitalea sp. CAU 1676 TaxID=3032598 RepID=UPI0023D9CDEC|nr:hypothetical protein [Paraflavitalea sp. CAU 1676]MDF2188534.1 hypothetical protein [Paraflavitalea sp. CAU 1676]